MTATVQLLKGRSLRVPAAEARSALLRVLGLPVVEAVARLRRGPGACEPVARLIDGAPESGMVVAAAVVGHGEDVVRVRRKAHGKADWITSRTSDVEITLGPVVLSSVVGELPPPVPVLPVAGIWERSLPAAEAMVLERLYDVLDPDLGVNIVDFGFVRDIEVSADGVVVVTMTLTSPTCPVTGAMVDQIRTALVGEDPVVADFRVEWVWTPAWRPSDLSPDGVAQLRAIGFDPVAR